MWTAIVHTDEAKLRRDVNDRPTPGPAHSWDGRLAPQEDARSVDVHNPMPFLKGGVFDLAMAADASIIDQDV